MERFSKLKVRIPGARQLPNYAPQPTEHQPTDPALPQEPSLRRALAVARQWALEKARREERPPQSTRAFYVLTQHYLKSRGSEEHWLWRGSGLWVER